MYLFTIKILKIYGIKFHAKISNIYFYDRDFDKLSNIVNIEP